MDWTPLFLAAELAPGGLRAHGPILVVRSADGALHALENACPHQGYPLAQGLLQGHTLTCCWHTWRFDVRSGACLLGEEGVTRHPLRVRDGMVEVRRELRVDRAAAWASLGEAMTRGQTGRIAREVARLRHDGLPVAELMAWGAAWDADRAEYGLGHAAALAAELLQWEEPPTAEARLAHDVQRVTEVLDLASRSGIGLGLRPRPTPVPPPADAGVALRVCVEAGDAAGAEALARGLVAAGTPRAAWAAALYPLVADHFLDFGHALIYLERVLALAAAAPASADALLGGYVRGLAQGTREDTLPAWAGFRSRRDGWLAGGGLLRAAAAPARSGDPAPVEAALLDGTAAEAFAAVAAALEAGARGAVGDALVRAGARRLLRFDPAHDADPTLEEGWLDATHRLTAASAARVALDRADPAAAAAIALATAHFIRLGRALDGPEPSPGPPPALAMLREAVLRDRRGRAIFFAHDIKTLEVGRVESERLGDPLPLQAAVRYLQAPVQERAVRRLAAEAARLVELGRPPRTLT